LNEPHHKFHLKEEPIHSKEDKNISLEIEFSNEAGAEKRSF
jgi:hypothetical protein